jgi:hypothetical protein
MSKSTLITDDVSKYVLDEMDKQGLSIDREVELERPSMPADITELGDEDLMLLYTKFAAYSDFVNTQLSCAIVDEKELERQVDYEESMAMLRLQDSHPKTTVTALKAMVDSDGNIKDLKKLHMNKYAYRKVLETLANNCERSSSVCSRELTRRTSGDNFKTRTRKFNV